MKSILILTFLCAILALGNAKKDIDIETVYKLLLKEVVKQNGRIESRLDDCSVKCPSGTKLFQKPGHQFSSNGCGSYNINIDFSSFNMQEFNGCCDVHDYCYETCNESKRRCDSNFEKCLTNQCNKWASDSVWSNLLITTCTSVAKLMTITVQNLGCSAYYSSQNDACYCS